MKVTDRKLQQIRGSKASKKYPHSVTAKITRSPFCGAQPEVYEQPLRKALEQRSYGTVVRSTYTAGEEFQLSIDCALANLEEAFEYLLDTLLGLRAPNGSVVCVYRNDCKCTVSIDHSTYSAILYEGRGDDVWQSIEATIDRSGELVFRADDIGRKVEAMFGTDHYVYWRTVAAPDVSKVFVALKHDLFRRAGDFDVWIRSNKRVEYAIDRNIAGVWPDIDTYQLWRRSNPRDAANGLLELLKERFGSGADFEDWLKEKGIDSEFRRAIGG